MRREDVDLLHGLWKEVTADPKYRELHHYHVLNVALQEMAERMHDAPERQQVLDQIYDEMRRGGGPCLNDENAPALAEPTEKPNAKAPPGSGDGKGPGR